MDSNVSMRLGMSAENMLVDKCKVGSMLPLPHLHVNLFSKHSLLLEDFFQKQGRLACHIVSLLQS